MTKKHAKRQLIQRVTDQDAPSETGWNRLLQRLLSAAESHGQDDDAEHEVGDLQGLLYTIWPLITDAEIRRKIATGSAEYLEQWEPESIQSKLERHAKNPNKCNPACPGWAVFETDRGLEIQICDACWSHDEHPLTDCEAAVLEDAKTALAIAKKLVRKRQENR